MDIKLLELVCNTPGISGYEDAIQDVVAATLQPRCDEVRRDRLGNVIGLRRATPAGSDERPLRVVLAAHADEIGGEAVGGGEMIEHARSRAVHAGLGSLVENEGVTVTQQKERTGRVRRDTGFAIGHDVANGMRFGRNRALPLAPDDLVSGESQELGIANPIFAGHSGIAIERSGFGNQSRQPVGGGG